MEKGYAVSFYSAYLVVRDIPYLGDKSALQTGAIVSKLVFTYNEHVSQDDHQVCFAGSVPFGLDGKLIPNLGGGPIQLPMSEASADVAENGKAVDGNGRPKVFYHGPIPPLAASNILRTSVTIYVRALNRHGGDDLYSRRRGCWSRRTETQAIYYLSIIALWEASMTEGLITTDPAIMLGKPVIHGTRITVEAILEKIANGETVDEILVDFPYLKRADVLGAVEYAMRVLKSDIVYTTGT
jgi:uncharacterized protein (DUF433 family)